jgi:hypothetical protein
MGSTSSRKKMIYQVTPFLSLPSYHLCLSIILMPRASYSPHMPLWARWEGSTLASSHDLKADPSAPFVNQGDGRADSDLDGVIGWGANKLFEMLDDEQNDPDFRGAVVAASFVEIFDETLIDLVRIHFFEFG